MGAAQDGNLRMIVEGEVEAYGRKTPGVGPPAIMAAGAGTVIPVIVSSTMNLKSEAIDGSIGQERGQLRKAVC